MTDRLDAALADLATAVEFPPTPRLDHGVAARIARPVSRTGWSRPMARAAVLGLGALLALATAAVGLGLVPGLRLSFVASPAPMPSAELLAGGLSLGNAVPPERLAAHAPSALGAPEEAYQLDDGRVRSLVYRATDRLPEIGTSGIGLLVQAIEGALDGDQVEKLVSIGSRVVPVSVDGADGFWIEGPPHVLRYLGPGGEPRAEESRLVGDALVWARGETLYRIESSLGLDETLRLAETIGR